MLALSLVCMLSQLDWDLNMDNLYTWQDQVPELQGHLLFSERIRLNATGSAQSDWSWGFAYEQGFLYQENLTLPLFSSSLRLHDFNAEIDRDKNWVWVHQLDRFFIQKEWDQFELVVGRQAVGHGNGRFFNPSDIFAPLTPYSLNTQYKRGIDGIKLNWNAGHDLELGALHFFNQNGPDLSVLRVAGHYHGLDFSSYAGSSYGEFTLGTDLVFTWLEAAWYTEGVFRKGAGRPDPVRLMAGVQRRFGTRLDAILEHQFYSEGLRYFAQPSYGVLEMHEILWGEVFFLGRNHSALALSFEWTPMVYFGLQWLHDYSGRSNWVLASLDWDMASNSQLRFGAMVPSGPALSEFGSFSRTAYMELRWYF